MGKAAAQAATMTALWLLLIPWNIYETGNNGRRRLVVGDEIWTEWRGLTLIATWFLVAVAVAYAGSERWALALSTTAIASGTFVAWAAPQSEDGLWAAGLLIAVWPMAVGGALLAHSVARVLLSRTRPDSRIGGRRSQRVVPR